MKRASLIFGLTLALLLAGVAQAAPPTKVNASYDLNKDGMAVGTIKETFSSDGKRYKIVSETVPAGIAAAFMRGTITVTSSGKVTPQGLQPEQASYTRSDKPAKNVSATFDWKMRLLRMQFDGKEETAPLDAATQDRISALYQFMYLKAAGLKTLTFPMTNGRKVEAYRYQLTSNEKIGTPLGSLDTLHLVRQRGEGDNQVELWLARDRRLFPVKLLIIENGGSRLEQTLTRLEIK